LTWRERLQRNHLRVGSVLPYVVAPPAEIDATFGQLQGEEDDDEADDDARIESRRKKVIVSHPPTEVEAPHEPLEDETGDEPRRKADAVGRWDTAGCDQRNGNVDVAPERARTATGEVVERDG